MFLSKNKRKNITASFVVALVSNFLSECFSDGKCVSIRPNGSKAANPSETDAETTTFFELETGGDETLKASFAVTE